MNAKSIPKKLPIKHQPRSSRTFCIYGASITSGQFGLSSIWRVTTVLKFSDAGVYRILKRNGLNRLPRGTRMRKSHTKRYRNRFRDIIFKGTSGENVRRVQYTAIDDATRVRALKDYEKHTQVNATLSRQGIVPSQAIINYAAELEWCAAIKVKRFKVNAKRTTPVTWRWVEAFATQAAQDDASHLSALCLFMFGAGGPPKAVTPLLQAGIDPKTVAVRGGWKDVATIMKDYAHAMEGPTVTDVLLLSQGVKWR